MALLDDTASHPPPTTGADAYNSDVRPGLGLTYDDTTFGETVKQLSAIGANAADETMYAHCLINADGTMYIQIDSTTTDLDVRRMSDGAVVAADQTGGNDAREVIWHPTDPDKYLFLDGTNISTRSVSGLSTAVVYAVGTTLQALGGSQNWCDKTGRYFHVKYGDAGHVIDKDEGVYTGTTNGAFGDGYMTISPDGNYAYFSDSDDLYSYALNHTTNAIGSAVQFMRGGAGGVGAGSDHSAFVSASDGENYGVTCLSHENTNLYAFDVTVDRSAMTGAQIVASCIELISFSNTAEVENHFSHGPNGSGQDWVFIATEDLDGDDFDQAPTTWRAFKQEILMVNVVTLATRRLAHHRSRSQVLEYFYLPRLSAAWDASAVMWASNMNENGTAGYSDLFGIENPLGAAEGGGFSIGQKGGIRPMRVSGLLR